MTFTGFGPQAVEFYQELELNNTKQWWSEHAQVYADAVKAPMLALMAELEGEFGAAKMFRPHRDVRFSADKSPYKTHQGAYVPTAPGAGWYVQIGPQGLLVGGGVYELASDQLARYRAALDEPRPAKALVAVLDALTGKEFELGGEQLKTRPRGVPADHPHLELLRRKALVVHHTYGEPDWLASPAAAERIRTDWRSITPLLEWISARIGPSTTRDG